MGFIGLSFFDQIACEGQPFNNNESPTIEQRLFGERLIGQSFVAPRDGLNRIDVMFMMYERRPAPPVSLRLLELPDDSENPAEGVEVFRAISEAGSIENQVWRRFELPPIDDSAQKRYLIALESPEAAFEEAVTVGGIERNVYTPGTAFFGSTPVPADITFRTCYEMSAGEKFGILAEQLTRHRSGIFGEINSYVATVIAYLFLAGVFFWRLMRLEI